MPDEPSESKAQCCSIPGKIFNFVLDSDAINVSVGSHLWIAVEVRPRPISVYVTVNKFKGGLMDTDSRLYRLNLEN
jgi:hypothetical protein